MHAVADHCIHFMPFPAHPAALAAEAGGGSPTPRQRTNVQCRRAGRGTPSLFQQRESLCAAI